MKFKFFLSFSFLLLIFANRVAISSEIPGGYNEDVAFRIAVEMSDKEKREKDIKDKDRKRRLEEIAREQREIQLNQEELIGLAQQLSLEAEKETKKETNKVRRLQEELESDLLEIAKQLSLEEEKEEKQVKGESNSYGVSTYNNAKVMQDFIDIQQKGPFTVFAIYDGHGTKKTRHQVAQYLSDNFGKLLLDQLNAKVKDGKISKELVELIIKAGFAKMQNDITKMKLDSGSTASIVIIDKINNRIWVAWLGDSRIVAVKNNKAVLATQDHSPEREDERKRIEATPHGVVTEHTDGYIKVYRINGVIAVSRGMGDNQFEKWGYSHIPEIMRINPSDINHIIMASDGIWNFTLQKTDDQANQRIVDLVVGFMKKNSLNKTAELLIDQIANKQGFQGSTDNISTIIIDVKKVFKK